ncbi:hypothetical protein EVAR_103093_1 [Eumeta japonica]|uniref:Uncharacterized protein n=1 Tax=Eumeta variegata TaxID=151549 RepID=A0A4C1WMN4_EUMVA|nr:hypothetical protein EVAR_103093_1 [Eumeta japonica]
MREIKYVRIESGPRTRRRGRRRHRVTLSLGNYGLRPPPPPSILSMEFIVNTRVPRMPAGTASGHRRPLPALCGIVKSSNVALWPVTWSTESRRGRGGERRPVAETPTHRNLMASADLPAPAARRPPRTKN